MGQIRHQPSPSESDPLLVDIEEGKKGRTEEIVNKTKRVALDKRRRRARRLADRKKKPTK